MNRTKSTQNRGRRNNWALIPYQTAQKRSKVDDVMDFTPFKQDIDELIDEFTRHGLTALSDMKRVWLSHKFSFIYEARPTNNLALFMQSLYAHAISHMISATGSLSQRLGGLYCMYCLYETQTFKPACKIYLSIGELSRLRNLVIEAKQNGIEVVPVLVKRMVERNMFLLGAVNVNDGLIMERVEEMTRLQNARIEFAYKTLFASTRIDEQLHMDLGVELDLQGLGKMSAEYAKVKELAMREAGAVVGIDDVKHIAEKKKLVGDALEKISEEWNAQKEVFYQETGMKPTHEEANAIEFERELEHLLTD